MQNKKLVLHEALSTYLESLRNAKKSERTLYTYGKDCEQINAFFGEKRELASISLALVGKFYKSDELLRLPNGEERAFKTVDKTKRVFRMFMIWAYERNFIDTLPLPKATPMGRSKIENAVEA
jgi:hypothetical protein